MTLLGRPSLVCRSCDEGGRRCLDHRHLRAVDVDDIRPAATEDAPDVNWGEHPASTEDLYDQYGSNVAGAAIAELERVAGIEPEITAAIVAAAPHDCRMHNLEFRMKSPSSLAGKIENKILTDPSQTPREITAHLADFVRYTVVAPTPDRVTDAAYETLSELKAKGWDVKEIEHSFVDGNPYKGLHSVVVHHSETDQDVEIQFHSEAGAAVKDQYHRDYETLRDQSQPYAERSVAFSTMVAAWNEIPTPPGLVDLHIGDVVAVEKAYGPPAPPTRPTKTS